MVVLFLGPKQGFLHFAVWSVSSNKQTNKQTESLCSMAPTDGKLKVLVLIVWQANVSTNIPCLSPKVGRIEGSQSLHSKNFSVPHQNLYWRNKHILTDQVQLCNHGNVGFSKYSSWTNSISITWELVINANSWPLPQTHWLRNSGCGAQEFVF